jgi:hypothetical protein
MSPLAALILDPERQTPVAGFIPQSGNESIALVHADLTFASERQDMRTKIVR